MHDIKAIRADPAAFDAALARRGLPPVAGGHSGAATPIGAPRRPRCRRSRRGATRWRRQSAQGKRSGADTAALEAEATALRGEMEALETQARRGADDEIQAMLERLPNILDADVPDGAGRDRQCRAEAHGRAARSRLPPKQHFELGEALGLMDFEAAAKIAGARFTVLRGPLARLERALGQFMLDLHTREHGYEETVVPSLVNDAAGLRHRPVAEIRRGSVPHHRRPLADPHRRGAADQPRRRRDPGREAACRCG